MLFVNFFKIFYVFGSCFRTLAVILVSDFLKTVLLDFCSICISFDSEEILGWAQSRAFNSHQSMWWPCSTQFSSVSALLCASLFNLSRARSLPQLIKAWMKTTLTCEFERTVLIKGADIQSRTQIYGCFSLRNAVCLIWSIKHLSSGFSLVRKWVRCRGFKFKSKDHSATVYYGTTPTETMFRCCSCFYYFIFYTADPWAWKIITVVFTHSHICRYTPSVSRTQTHIHTHTHTHT